MKQMNPHTNTLESLSLAIACMAGHFILDIRQMECQRSISRQIVRIDQSAIKFLVQTHVQNQN